MEEKYRNIINKWLEKSFKDEKWKNYLDLHLDDINKEFENVDTWIDTGINLLQLSNVLNKNVHFEVVLIVPLNSEDKIIGVNFSDKSSLLKELTFTPPSLYLFQKNWKNWKETLEECKSVNINGISGCRIYYREVMGNDGDYIRALYLRK